MQRSETVHYTERSKERSKRICERLRLFLQDYKRKAMRLLKEI